MKELLKFGDYVINCMICFFICYEFCGIENNDCKEYCVVMSKGYCIVCIDNCIWYVYENMLYMYIYKCVKVIKFYKEMKFIYEVEKGKILDFNGYFEYLNKDIKVLLEWFYDKVKIVIVKGNELKGI